MIDAPLIPPAERRLYRIREQEPAEIPLSELMPDGSFAIYPAVMSRGYFEIRLAHNRLVLQPGNFIGVIPINDHIAIDVVPRVDVSNLDRVLLLSGKEPSPIRGIARSYAVAAEENPSLLDHLALALIDALREIELNGLHADYLRREMATSFPRGRILMGPTVITLHARRERHKAQTTWFERIADTPPNRCLKYAIWFLAQRYSRLRPRKGMRAIRGHLNVMYHLFDQVPLDHSLSFLTADVVQDPTRLPSIRAYYAPALRLATTLLTRRSLSFQAGDASIRAASLVIDMTAVFEAYVRRVLRRHFERQPSNIAVLDGNRRAQEGGGGKRLLDEGADVGANPDVVLRRVDDDDPMYPVLVEVKYKALTGPPPRDDLNQVIAYAVSYRCPNVVVVHALGSEGRPGLNRIGRIENSELFQYGMDLDATDLVKEEELLATTIEKFCSGSGPGAAK